MITYLKITGFKSFHNFEMQFTPFTIIAGANASGKSNLFDVIKLLANLADSAQIHQAFNQQRGELLELFTQYDASNYATEMEFCVEMLVNKKLEDACGNYASLKHTRLRYELKIGRFINEDGFVDIEVLYEHLAPLKPQLDDWVQGIIPTAEREIWRPEISLSKRVLPYLFTEHANGIATVIVPADGDVGIKRRIPLKNTSNTVLSTIDTLDFPHLLAAREEMKSWKYLQLNLQELRQPSDKANCISTLSSTGANLAAVLHRVSLQHKYSLALISKKLQMFVPNFIQVDVVDDLVNNQYIIRLIDHDRKIYSSRVLSEGVLRLLALCMLETDEQFTGVLCLEEPEKGIHPFKIEALASLLKDLTTGFTDVEMPLRQLIINTNSSILVAALKKWNPSELVSLWYAEMISRTTDIQGKRVKLTVSDMQVVLKEGESSSIIPISESNRRLTFTTVKQYLEIAENAFD